MKIKEIYIPVQLSKGVDAEYLQKVLQEKTDTGGVFRVEDVVDIKVKDFNEAFQEQYVIFKDKEAALELLDYIDPNYDEGFFFVIAARNRDIDMLTALIERGNQKDPGNTINSIQEGLIASANARQKECVKMLVDNGANPKLLAGTSIYSYINECITSET